jgi:hypothetical protein
MICSPEAVVMAFPGVCAIAAVGTKTAEMVKAAKTMTAKVENFVSGKRRMLVYLLERSGACLSEGSR